MGWLGWNFPFVGAEVLSIGRDVLRDVVCVGGDGFYPRLWRLCAVCVGVGLGGGCQLVGIEGRCLANSLIGDVVWWRSEASSFAFLYA
jgi:hypothetical protein